MGSPLSPVIANIYMQDLESRVLGTAPLKPLLWLSYVNDTFVMWNHGDKELQNFLKHLNGQHADIRFTMERDDNGTIPFLDVHGDKLTTSVYRKPTHTDRYLNYDSHHHPKVKSSIVDCLSHRERWICKKGSALSDELKHVHNALMTKGMHSEDGIRRGDEMVPVLVIQKPGCFYHTSRASVKGLAEYAGDWVSTPLSPPEIPSRNSSRNPSRK